LIAWNKHHSTLFKEKTEIHFSAGRRDEFWCRRHHWLSSLATSHKYSIGNIAATALPGAGYEIK